MKRNLLYINRFTIALVAFTVVFFFIAGACNILDHFGVILLLFASYTTVIAIGLWYLLKYKND